MTFINTDGMAFIGPGSEWFWTALSGIVLAVTFLAIYRQLRLQRSANAKEQLASANRDWGSERMLRNRLEILLALRDGTDQADLPLAAAVAVADYWNDIGDLTREGHLERRVVDEANCRLWWATIAPFVRKARVEWGDPGIAENWEWLVRALTEAHLRTGREAVDYTAMLAEKLDGRISATQGAIAVEQSLRTVIIATPETVPAAPPVTAAAAEGEHGTQPTRTDRGGATGGRSAPHRA